MEPAFVVRSARALPDSAGDYEIKGLTKGGEVLFQFDFDMPEEPDGNGSSSFAFGLPVQSGWIGNLASVTPSGPGGTATLDEPTDRPMTILRSRQTGQARGVLRGQHFAALEVAALMPDVKPILAGMFVDDEGRPAARAREMPCHVPLVREFQDVRRRAEHRGVAGVADEDQVTFAGHEDRMSTDTPERTWPNDRRGSNSLPGSITSDT